MAESRRNLFLAGAGGNIAPILLKWWAEEGISVPGDTWLASLGWAITTIGFALFAGWVARDVWKEETARRAFVVGLALPYILWGLLADTTGVVKIRGARADEVSPYGTTELYGKTLEQVIKERFDLREGLVVLRVQARAADSEKPLPEANVQVYAAAMGTTIAGRGPNTYALRPGKYRVTAAAPGYATAHIDLDLSETHTVTLVLQPLSLWEQFVSGVKAVVLPTPARLPQRLPFDLR
jgi:hypothetical protein